MGDGAAFPSGRGADGSPDYVSSCWTGQRRPGDRWVEHYRMGRCHCASQPAFGLHAVQGRGRIRLRYPIYEETDQFHSQPLTWVAVDVVAAALQEMIVSDERALHLVSPIPVPWDAVFGPMAKRLGLPVVPYDEWIAQLETSAADVRARGGVEGHESAHNLIGFFKSEGMGGAAVPLSTAKAVKASKALADARPLGSEDAVRYVEFWAKVGHLAL